jgi:hypothetical protein
MGGALPHPPTPLLFVNVADVSAILVLAAVLTFIKHAVLFFGFNRPYEKSLRGQMRVLRHLRVETMKLRSKGLAAFVETSKMERKMLAKEKELQELQEAHKKRMELAKKVIKRMHYILYFLVFLAYYKTPVIRVSGNNPDYETDGGDRTFVKGMLFPHSMIGMGNKVANYGMGNGGIGSLMVYYSAEVTVGRILGCLEIILAP